MLLPYAEHRPIFGRRKVVASRIAHAGHPQAVQFAKEFPRAVEFLFVRWSRKLVVQSDDGGLGAVIPPVRFPLLSFSVRAPEGRSASDAIFRSLQSGSRKHGPAVPELHINRIVRRCRFEFGLRGTTSFLELICRPAATDDKPRARLHGRRRLTDSIHGFGDRGHTHPVHFAAVGQAGANRMNMRIDQARNNGAALKIDHLRARPRSFPDIRCCSNRQNSAVVYRQCFADGEVAIDGQDLSIDEYGVRRLRPRRRDAETETETNTRPGSSRISPFGIPPCRRGCPMTAQGQIFLHHRAIRCARHRLAPGQFGTLNFVLPQRCEATRKHIAWRRTAGTGLSASAAAVGLHLSVCAQLTG